MRTLEGKVETHRKDRLQVNYHSRPTSCYYECQRELGILLIVHFSSSPYGETAALAQPWALSHRICTLVLMLPSLLFRFLWQMRSSLLPRYFSGDATKMHLVDTNCCC